jgi:S1-C subfamily serine protease
MHAVVCRLLTFAIGTALAALMSLALAQSAPEVQARATVHEMSQPGSAEGYCSAVAISPGVAWTAAHCYAGVQAYGPAVLRVGSKEYLVTHWAVPRKDVDFAILTVPGLQCPCAVVGKDEMLDGFKTVLALGYPQGGELTAAYGYFVGWAKIPDPEFNQAPTLMVTARLIPGFSGGGLFILYDDVVYLVGINIASLSDGRMSFAVDVTQ